MIDFVYSCLAMLIRGSLNIASDQGSSGCPHISWQRCCRKRFYTRQAPSLCAGGVSRRVAENAPIANLQHVLAQRLHICRIMRDDQHLQIETRL